MMNVTAEAPSLREQREARTAAYLAEKYAPHVGLPLEYFEGETGIRARPRDTIVTRGDRVSTHVPFDTVAAMIEDEVERHERAIERVIRGLKHTYGDEGVPIECLDTVLGRNAKQFYLSNQYYSQDEADNAVAAGLVVAHGVVAELKLMH